MNAPGMPQLHDMTDTFDEALAGMRETLADARRQLAAWSLVNYPSKDTLNAQAHELRKTLKAAVVEINAVTKDRLTVVAAAPKSLADTEVAAAESLCVLTTGLGSPLAVDDMHTDPVASGHVSGGPDSEWYAWASAPITINGFTAGTVCALEREHPRVWTTEDQEALEDMAARVGRLIDIWSGA